MAHRTRMCLGAVMRAAYRPQVPVEPLQRRAPRPLIWMVAQPSCGRIHPREKRSAACCCVERGFIAVAIIRATFIV
jgi:hypothetical protein